MRGDSAIKKMKETGRNEAANMENTEQDTSFSKSLLKTLNILEQYSKADELGIKDISENTGIPASTVQRIVNTLAMKQYLVQNPDTLKYRLGIAFFNISSRYNNSRGWIEAVRTRMEEQAERTKETVNLAILQGKNVIYLTKIDSPHILRPNFTVGKPFPAFNTALGRCLLAHQSWKTVEKLMKEQEDIQLDPTKFKKVLDGILENGYAMEDEEFQPGLFCVSAPIWDANEKVIAAISTSIPKIRLDDQKKKESIRLIRETAAQISTDLKARFKYIDIEGLALMPQEI